MYHFDWSEIRPEIKDTVLLIEKRRSFAIDQRYTTKTPALLKTDQEWFMEYAKTTELVQLLDYPNGAVKALSFQSLLRKEDPKLYDYIINSLDHKEVVYLDLKCIGGEIGVTEYYLFLLGYPFIGDHSLINKEHLFTKDQIKILDSIAATKSSILFK